MARQEINQEFNTFVGGILTEANPINFPAGFSLDERNFILERSGTRRRRYGLGSHSSNDATQNGGNYFLWQNGYTESDGTKRDVMVTWSADGLATPADYDVVAYIIDDEDDLFSNELTTLTLTSQVSAPRITAYEDTLIITEQQFQVAASLPVTGALTARNLYTTRLYKIDGTTLTTDSDAVQSVQIRDFQRILPEDYKDRNATLTDIRSYNLLASGWNTTNYAQFNTDTATYPGLSDNMNTGLSATTGVFTSTWVQNANNGTALIPGGGQILNLNAIDYDRAFIHETLTGGATSLSSDHNTAYILDTVSYAGRAFHLVYTPGSLTSNTSLCFSRIITETEDILKCYQTNDPTARDFNQILDTDGGLVDLTLVGTGISLLVLNNKIIIFGSNGIFELFSTENVFRPTSLNLRKITDIEVLGQPVIVEDQIFLVANGGIYALVYNANSSEFQAINITESSIQTFVNSLPRSTKDLVRSVYVDSDKVVRFLFGTFTDNTLTELVYDIPLKAWYKNIITSSHITSSNFEVKGYLLLKGFDDQNTTYPVDSRMFLITHDSISSDVSPAFFKYVAWQHSETDFVDKITKPSGPFEFEETSAFLQTGYINLGDTQRQKQSSYIVPSFLRTEDGFTDDGNGNLTPTNESSCMISAWWDYVDDASQPKANTPFEAYRYNRLYIPEDASDTFDYGQSVLTTKNRLTGRGRALSLRFESSAGKDCQLLGWGMDIETNNRV